MHIAINYCDWQNVITNKWPPQPTVLTAHINFEINKRLRFTVKQVSVALVVSADACMQGIQGSNPVDDYNVLRQSKAFFA